MLAPLLALAVAAAAAPAASTDTAKAAPKVSELRALEISVLNSPACDKRDEDVNELAPDLKEKFSLISCEYKSGLSMVLLAPKDVMANRRLDYRSIKDGAQTIRLTGARFFGHYLVLEFEGQVQYLDLLKPDPEIAGFSPAGFVSQGTATRFEDVEAFADALRNYMGIASSDTDAAAADDVVARLPEHAAGKPYRLTASVNARGELIVVARIGARSVKLWPTSVRRLRK